MARTFRPVLPWLLLSVGWFLTVHFVSTDARQAPFSAAVTSTSSSATAFSVPECYPFCSNNDNDRRTVSAVEAARYRDRLGTLKWVDPRIGTNGPDPSEYGGMVPSVALPFAGVRTVPMTRENLVSGCAYHDNDTVNIGFLASRQPAIWMGDYGFATIFAGRGDIKLGKHARGHSFARSQEFVSSFKYAVRMGNSSAAGDGIFAELAGKSRAAMMQYTFDLPRDRTAQEKERSSESPHESLLSLLDSNSSEKGPYIGIQASREQWRGAVRIDAERGEVSGYNTERMDYRLGPHEAPGFRGYFVYRFEYQQSDSSSDEWTSGFPLDGLGTAHTNATGIAMHPGERARWNELGVYAFVRFPASSTKVRIRLGMSLISEEQARYNLDIEMPDGTSVEAVVDELIDAWRSKTDRIKVQGGSEQQKRILYTGIFHASQYPAEHAEPIPHSDGRTESQPTMLRHETEDKHKYHYYSGYTDSVHKVREGVQRYQSWSIWDIYRAQWNLLILFEPRRVVDMVRSLLDIYDESGFLPMWSTLAETNIMISTHADSLIAEAAVKGVRGFDIGKAWEAVHKDGTVPPEREDELRYEDREEYTPIEVRAGLTFYNHSGYVPLDGWSESTSRTLDYAYDDHAIAVFADLLEKQDDATFFHNRSKNYRHVFDHGQGLMAARLKNGSFLIQPLPDPRGRQEGFTEGNMFDYSFDVVQDVPGLAELVGGRDKLIALLDRHFNESHNDQSNKPSHHIPYLYSLLGEASKTQKLVRDISYEGFSDRPDGYAGNEDCGQQSAWYIFSSMGIYPVNPVSGEYVISSPFFEAIEIDIPARFTHGETGVVQEGKGARLRIEAPGADDQHVYVANLTVNGRDVDQPKLKWTDLLEGGTWTFGLSDVPQEWGNDKFRAPLSA